MSTAEEKRDNFKLAAAFLLVAAAVGVFYLFPDTSPLYRTLGILVAMAVAVAIALQTAKGVWAKDFVIGARTEVRKVVWPSQRETLQTTLIVIVTVILVALLLWGIDSLLSWLVAKVLGT